MEPSRSDADDFPCQCQVQLRFKPQRMEPAEANTLFYRRSHFVTHLPLNRLYSPSHCWLLEQQGIWRVGLTKFATRVLGEIVDYGFEAQPGATIKAGDVWVGSKDSKRFQICSAWWMENSNS